MFEETGSDLNVSSNVKLDIQMWTLGLFDWARPDERMNNADSQICQFNVFKFQLVMRVVV